MIFFLKKKVTTIINLCFMHIKDYFVKNYFDKIVAIFSALFFSFTPAAIFFVGHAIHPDAFVISIAYKCTFFFV